MPAANDYEAYGDPGKPAGSPRFSFISLIIIGLVLYSLLHYAQTSRTAGAPDEIDVTLQPASPLQISRQAVEFIRLRDYPRAIQAFEFLLDNYPDWPDADRALFAVGVCWMEMDEPERAMETWRRFLRDYSESKYASDVRELYFLMGEDRFLETARPPVLLA